MAVGSMPAACHRLLKTHVFKNIWAVPRVPSGLPRYALLESGRCTEEGPMSMLRFQGSQSRQKDLEPWSFSPFRGRSPPCLGSSAWGARSGMPTPEQAGQRTTPATGVAVHVLGGLQRGLNLSRAFSASASVGGRKREGVFPRGRVSTGPSLGTTFRWASGRAGGD